MGGRAVAGLVAGLVAELDCQDSIMQRARPQSMRAQPALLVLALQGLQVQKTLPSVQGN